MKNAKFLLEMLLLTSIFLSSSYTADAPAREQKVFFVLGGMGVGKSSFLNYIFNEEQKFKSSNSTKSCTQDSTGASYIHQDANGNEVELVFVDTPGINEFSFEIEADHQINIFNTLLKYKSLAGIIVVVPNLRVGHEVYEMINYYREAFDFLVDNQQIIFVKNHLMEANYESLDYDRTITNINALFAALRLYENVEQEKLPYFITDFMIFSGTFKKKIENSTKESFIDENNYGYALWKKTHPDATRGPSFAQFVIWQRENILHHLSLFKTYDISTLKLPVFREVARNLDENVELIKMEAGCVLEIVKLYQPRYEKFLQDWPDLAKSQNELLNDEKSTLINVLNAIRASNNIPFPHTLHADIDVNDDEKAEEFREPATSEARTRERGNLQFINLSMNTSAKSSKGNEAKVKENFDVHEYTDENIKRIVNKRYLDKFSMKNYHAYLEQNSCSPSEEVYRDWLKDATSNHKDSEPDTRFTDDMRKTMTVHVRELKRDLFSWAKKFDDELFTFLDSEYDASSGMIARDATLVYHDYLHALHQLRLGELDHQANLDKLAYCAFEQEAYGAIVETVPKIGAIFREIKNLEMKRISSPDEAFEINARIASAQEKADAFTAALKDRTKGVLSNSIINYFFQRHDESAEALIDLLVLTLKNKFDVDDFERLCNLVSRMRQLKKKYPRGWTPDDQINHEEREKQLAQNLERKQEEERLAREMALTQKEERSVVEIKQNEQDNEQPKADEVALSSDYSFTWVTNVLSYIYNAIVGYCSEMFGFTR